MRDKFLLRSFARTRIFTFGALLMGGTLLLDACTADGVLRPALDVERLEMAGAAIQPNQNARLGLAWRRFGSASSAQAEPIAQPQTQRRQPADANQVATGDAVTTP